jgi:purine-binding chemotaxis protein CheW
VAVRTEHGPVAFATGAVLGIRATRPDTVGSNHALLGPASNTLIAGVSTIDGQPLLLLQSMRVVPEDVWAAAAEATVPPS